MMVDFELGEYIRTFSNQSHRWLSVTVELPLTAISLQEPLFLLQQANNPYIDLCLN